MDDQIAAPAEGEVTPEVVQIEEPAPSQDVVKEPEKTDESRKNTRRAERRIAQLTAEKREMERRLAALEQRPAETPKTPDEPKREDFADYEQYIEAKAEYKAIQAAERKLGEADKANRQAAERAQATAQERAFAEAREAVIDRGTELYDDFEAVTTNEELPITPVMADALLSSEKGHELWYHLGKNPDVAERIAGLHPVKQIYELGRLDAQIAGGKRASAAPKPIDPVSPRGSNNNALRDNIPISEWMKRRSEEVRKSSI